MKNSRCHLFSGFALAAIALAPAADAANRIWAASTNTTWNTSTANWSGTAFANGDTAIFSAATGNSALTLGSSVTALNLRSNGATTPATTTLTGAAGFTLSLGSATAGSGNLTALNGTSAYEQNLTYNMVGAGSGFALVAGSGTTATPTIWNIASGKTFAVNAGSAGQIADLNGNTVNLTGTGTVNFNSGTTLKSTGATGTFNVNAGTLSLTGGTNRVTTIDSSITVNVAASGTLTLAVNSGAGSTFSQATNLNGGTLTNSNVQDLVLAGTVTLGAGTTSTLTFQTTGNNTINALAGSGNATLTQGVLVLTNANSLSGGTITNTGGTLQLGNATALGTDSLALNGGTLSSSSTTGYSLGNALSLGGDVTLGSATNTGKITFSSTTNLGGATRTLTVASTVELSGVVSNGSITKAGAGSLILSNVGNSMTGGTSISGGVIQVNATGAMGTGTITFNTGAQHLRVAGGVTVANDITITGATGVSGGGLLESTAASGGTATLNGTITINSAPTNGGHFANTVLGSTFNIKGAINSSSIPITQRAGTVTYWGGGSYASMGVNGTAKLGATNGLATNAMVTLGYVSDITQQDSLDLAGYNQTLAGITQGYNASTIGNSSTTADSVLTTTGTSAYAGVIQDSLGTGTRKVALTVNGGALTLSGANTYSGATLISGGTLKLDAAGTINNTSEVSLGTVGTFDVSAKGLGYTVGTLKGSGNVTGALTVSTQLAIGNSPGTISFSSGLTLDSATYAYEMTGGMSPGAGSADLANITGALTITAGSILDLVELGHYTPGNKFTLFGYTTGITGTFDGLANNAIFFDDLANPWKIQYADGAAGTNGGTGTNFVTITAVPEPEPAAVLGGLGLLALLRRRR